MEEIAGKRSLKATLGNIHERFITGGIDATNLDMTPLSPVIAQSWQRSLAEGVDPDGLARQTISDELAAMRDGHPLAAVMPVIRQLLTDDAASSGAVVAVAGGDGTLLWVEGDRRACRRVEAMNFVPGADWSEHRVGTNAPGTALALDRPVQIRGAEHFSRAVQPWNCTAVPVHDRASGAVIGAIDLTGSGRVVTSTTLALLRATAVAVENQMALLRFAGVRGDSPASARLTVLGARPSRWVVTDAGGSVRVTTLSGRHAEILVLLSRHPEGLTADHLAMLLDEADLDPVTVRAEMSRLRKVVGSDFIDSRPYRLLKPIGSDIGDVLTALDSADVRSAVAQYRGPLLPRSLSPGIGRLRTELNASMRGAVLASGNPAVMRQWLDLPEGRDDREGWQLLHDTANGDAAACARARGHLAGLDAELG
ncbi:helix-turn-helix domain-containing protein [Mycolicibacter acidiphilus]